MQTAGPTAHANVLTRHHTFLGVCEAIGEDFSFNPIYLRIALGVALLWNPVVVLGGYLAAGLVVGLSRWLAPNPALAEAMAGGAGLERGAAGGGQHARPAGPQAPAP